MQTSARTGRQISATLAWFFIIFNFITATVLLHLKWLFPIPFRCNFGCQVGNLVLHSLCHQTHRKQWCKISDCFWEASFNRVTWHHLQEAEVQKEPRSGHHRAAVHARSFLHFLQFLNTSSRLCKKWEGFPLLQNSDSTLNEFTFHRDAKKIQVISVHSTGNSAVKKCWTNPTNLLKNKLSEANLVLWFQLFVVFNIVFNNYYLLLFFNIIFISK